MAVAVVQQKLQPEQAPPLRATATRSAAQSVPPSAPPSDPPIAPTVRPSASAAPPVPSASARAASAASLAPPAIEPDADYALAQAHELDDGVAKDVTKAVELYRRAAAQGHAGAQYHLGGCLWNGQAVTKNRAEAFTWFERAAAAGHEKAQRLVRSVRRGKKVILDW